MKELTYVWTKDCSKCYTIKPHVKKRCEKNKVNFVEMEYADSWLELFSVPAAIYDNWDSVEVLDLEGIVGLLSWE